MTFPDESLVRRLRWFFFFFSQARLECRLFCTIGFCHAEQHVGMSCFSCVKPFHCGKTRGVRVGGFALPPSPPERSGRLYGLENVTKNCRSESGGQQMTEKWEFRGQNLSLGQIQGSSRGVGMRVAFGTRNHSAQNLANRPNGALAFLIPCRPPFRSRGCSAQGHGLKVPLLLRCCFSLSQNSMAIITVGPAQPTPEDGFCARSHSVCMCAKSVPVCCYKGCGLDV